MDKLDAILQAHVAQGQDTKDKLLGAAFIVTTKDDTLYSGSAGRTGFDPSSPPFSADSFTWVASLTKLVTATCLLQLVERGAMSLDADDLRDTVPELAGMQILRGFDDDGKPILEDNHRPITLRTCLTHTLGLGYDLADPDLTRWSHATGRSATNLDWSRAGFAAPLKFAPESGWFYGAALDWAAHALSTITTQLLSAHAQAHIFDPLDMRDSTFWPGPEVAARTAAYAYREDGSLRPEPKPVPDEHEIESGGAGLFTTAADYAALMRGLLAGRLLRADTLSLLFAPQLDDAQRAMLEDIAYAPGSHGALAPEFPRGLRLDHGLGGVLNMDDVPGKRRRGSMMWSGMCNSRWWIDRVSGIGAVLIVNVQPHGDPVVNSLYHELELAVYEHLVSKIK